MFASRETAFGICYKLHKNKLRKKSKQIQKSKFFINKETVYTTYIHTYILIHDPPSKYIYFFLTCFLLHTKNCETITNYNNHK